MDKNKLMYVSDIKGGMTLLVIIGHSCILYTGFWSSFVPQESSLFLNFITNWLDSFDTYAFVFVSGFIFYNLKYEVEKYNNDKVLIIKKIKRLIVPYILTCCFWAIPIYSLLFSNDLMIITKRYVLGYDPDQLWFLLMLFWVFIITLSVGKLLNFKREKMIIDILVTLGCYVVYLFSIIVNYWKIPNLFRINSAFTYELYFVLGMFFCKNYFIVFEWSFLKKYRLFLIAILSIIINLVISLLFFCEIVDGGLKYMIAPINTCLAILFSYIVIMKIKDSSFLHTNNVVLIIWKKFCKNSFMIYLLHQQTIYFIIFLVNKPGIPPIIVGLLIFVISVTVSSIICMLLNFFANKSKSFGEN